MVDVDEAVRIATTYLSKVMPGYVALQPKIEEFELSEDGAVWNITFSSEESGRSKWDSQYLLPLRR
jgi:hypothetical protein